MITIYTGIMFTGKTKALILKYNELRDKNISCLMIKPAIDKRFSTHEVVSRSGHRALADMVISDNEISCLLPAIKAKNAKAVFFDEVQFLSNDFIYLVQDLVHAKIDVYLSGLTKDSNDKPFGCLGQIANLSGVSKKTFEVECAYPECDEVANLSYCLVDKTDKILIGDKGYEPRCFKHIS